MFRCRNYGIAFLAVWNGRITRGEETITRNNANTNAFKDLSLKTGTKIVGLWLATRIILRKEGRVWDAEVISDPASQIHANQHLHHDFRVGDILRTVSFS